MTFPGTIRIDTNPLSLSDYFYFEIGDIRDICFTINISDLFDKGFSFKLDERPKMVIPYETPHEQRPTFCKGVSEFLFSDGKYRMTISREAFFCATY